MGRQLPRQGEPQTDRRSTRNSRIKEKAQECGARARYPKKDDSHLLLGRQEKYRFIKHHKLKFPVGKMCKMFKVSKSGYYNWLDRRPSKRWEENRVISSLIRDIFENSFKSYGALRVRTELLKKGYNISQAKGSQDNELQQPIRQKEAQVQGHYGLKTRLSDSAENFGPGFQGLTEEQGLGIGYHLYRDRTRLGVPNGNYRPVQQKNRRMVHERNLGYRIDHCPGLEHGHSIDCYNRRAHIPLRKGISICQP